MADLFKKYGATPTKTIAKLAKDEDSKIGSGNRSDRLELVDGPNKIRLGPKHPGEESFLHLRSTIWITIEDDKGQPSRRSVNNARVMLGVEVDPGEFYLEQAKIKLATGKASDGEKLKKLTDYKTGISSGSAWLSYAKLIKDGKRGPWELFEMKRTVRDALKNEMVIEDEEEAIEMDPFTDPKKGKNIIITYNSKAKKAADYYKVQVLDKENPLSKEEMEAYDKLKPIDSLPEMGYYLADFDMIIAGIQYFDESLEIGLMDDEDFKAELLKIKKSIKAALKGISVTSSDEDIETDEVNDDLPFPDEDEVEESKPKGKKTLKKEPIKKASKKVVIEDDDENQAEDEAIEDDETEEAIEEDAQESDQFDEMSRSELVAYKKEHYSDVSDLKLLKSDSDDDMRNKLREYEATLNEEAPDDEDEVVEDDEPEEEPIIKKSKKPLKKQGEDEDDESEGEKPKLTVADIKKQLESRPSKKAGKK